MEHIRQLNKSSHNYVGNLNIKLQYNQIVNAPFLSNNSWQNLFTFSFELSSNIDCLRVEKTRENLL